MHPVSMTSRPVRLFIHEKGIPVEEEVVDLFTGAHHQEPFASINPNKLVPVQMKTPKPLKPFKPHQQKLSKLQNIFGHSWHALRADPTLHAAGDGVPLEGLRPPLREQALQARTQRLRPVGAELAVQRLEGHRSLFEVDPASLLEIFAVLDPDSLGRQLAVGPARLDPLLLRAPHLFDDADIACIGRLHALAERLVVGLSLLLEVLVALLLPSLERLVALPLGVEHAADRDIRGLCLRQGRSDDQRCQRSARRDAGARARMDAAPPLRPPTRPGVLLHEGQQLVEQVVLVAPGGAGVDVLAAAQAREGVGEDQGGGAGAALLQQALDGCRGTNSMVHHVQQMVRVVRDRYPKVHRLAIGDLSSKRGGHLAPHISHQTGRDVDLGFYYKKRPQGYPKSFVLANAKNLHFGATWTMLRTLCATANRDGGVERIFLDYPLQKLIYEWARKRKVSRRTLSKMFQYPHGRGTRAPIIHHDTGGHDDHIHVRFKCPPDDRGCVD